MDEKDVREAAAMLLREAIETNHLICRATLGGAPFIRVQKSYLEETSLRACQLLLQEEKICSILKTHAFELFEPTALGMTILMTFQQAKDILEAELAGEPYVFVIHSPDGEFVQCGSRAHNQDDRERVLFLNALADMRSHGSIKIAYESEEAIVYAPTESKKPPTRLLTVAA